MEKPDRLIREAECQHLTGVSRTQRWRLEQRDKFPKRRHPSEGITAWVESEVLAWLAEQIDDDAPADEAASDARPRDKGRFASAAAE